MRRPVLAAIVGIVALGLGATGVILWLTRDEAPVADVPGDGPAQPANAPPPLPVADVIRKATPPTDQPPPESLHEEPPPPPARDSWEAVAPAGRIGALRGIGGALGRELNEIRPRIEGCFDEDTQSRFGRTPFSTVRDLQPIGDEGIMVLMLQLETRPGQVVIVDAPVEARGRASDGLIACVQQQLRGATVDAPRVKAGERYRVRYPVME